MTWLNGLGYKHWGARGLMSVDTLANGLGGIALFIFAAYVRRLWVQGPEPQLTERTK